MLAGIPGAREVVLPRTGHMFRFTHPDLYGHAITDFIDEAITLSPFDRPGAGRR
jgi:hypothetical protein